MGELKILHNFILEKNQDLESQYYQDTKFLKVTKYCGKGLRYYFQFKKEKNVFKMFETKLSHT